MGWHAVGIELVIKAPKLGKAARYFSLLTKNKIRITQSFSTFSERSPDPVKRIAWNCLNGPQYKPVIADPPSL